MTLSTAIVYKSNHLQPNKAKAWESIGKESKRPDPYISFPCPHVQNNVQNMLFPMLLNQRAITLWQDQKRSRHQRYQTHSQGSRKAFVPSSVSVTTTTSCPTSSCESLSQFFPLPNFILCTKLPHLPSPATSSAAFFFKADSGAPSSHSQNKAQAKPNGSSSQDHLGPFNRVQDRSAGSTNGSPFSAYQSPSNSNPWSPVPGSAKRLKNHDNSAFPFTHAKRRY